MRVGKTETERPEDHGPEAAGRPNEANDEFAAVASFIEQISAAEIQAKLERLRGDRQRHRATGSEVRPREGQETTGATTEVQSQRANVRTEVAECEIPATAEERTIAKGRESGETRLRREQNRRPDQDDVERMIRRLSSMKGKRRLYRRFRWFIAIALGCALGIGLHMVTRESIEPWCHEVVYWWTSR